MALNEEVAQLASVLCPLLAQQTRSPLGFENTIRSDTQAAARQRAGTCCTTPSRVSRQRSSDRHTPLHCCTAPRRPPGARSVSSASAF